MGVVIVRTPTTELIQSMYMRPLGKLTKISEKCIFQKTQSYQFFSQYDPHKFSKYLLADKKSCQKKSV